jgi:hypothetical protein
MTHARFRTCNRSAFFTVAELLVTASRHYAEILKRRVRHVTLTIAPGSGHEILLEPVTYDALKSLVGSLERSEQR